MKMKVLISTLVMTCSLLPFAGVCSGADPILTISYQKIANDTMALTANISASQYNSCSCAWTAYDARHLSVSPTTGMTTMAKALDYSPYYSFYATANCTCTSSTITVLPPKSLSECIEFSISNTGNGKLIMQKSYSGQSRGAAGQCQR